MVYKPVSLDLSLEGLHLRGPFRFYKFRTLTGGGKLCPGWHIVTCVPLTLGSSGASPQHDFPKYFVIAPHVHEQVESGTLVASGSCSLLLLQVHLWGPGGALGPADSGQALLLVLKALSSLPEATFRSPCGLCVWP